MLHVFVFRITVFNCNPFFCCNNSGSSFHLMICVNFICQTFPIILCRYKTQTITIPKTPDDAGALCSMMPLKLVYLCGDKGMYSEGFLPAAFLVIIYGRTQVSPTGWYEAKTTVGANCGLPQITGNKPSPSAIAATSPEGRGFIWLQFYKYTAGASPRPTIRSH